MSELVGKYFCPQERDDCLCGPTIRHTELFLDFSARYLRDAKGDRKPWQFIYQTALGALTMSSSKTDHEDAETGEWRSLALAARQGDRQAVNSLLQQARPRLVRMALAFGAPPDDVPDLVQEVLLAAWRNIAELDPSQGSFLTWVARGLHGRVANLRRGSGRRAHFKDRWRGEHGDEEALAQRPHGAVDARMTLAKLLRSLTPRQRDVVALYELGGLSGKEAAAVLGIREAAVRSIARDARKVLARHAEARTVNQERIA